MCGPRNSYSECVAARGIPRSGGSSHFHDPSSGPVLEAPRSREGALKRGGTLGAGRDDRGGRQPISLKIEKTGMYKATIMPPMTRPITPIMSGSMSDVSDSAVDCTSSS